MPNTIIGSVALGPPSERRETAAFGEEELSRPALLLVVPYERERRYRRHARSGDGDGWAGFSRRYFTWLSGGLRVQDVEAQILLGLLDVVVHGAPRLIGSLARMASRMAV
jgi:hypothetical protein